MITSDNKSQNNIPFQDNNTSTINSPNDFEIKDNNTYANINTNEIYKSIIKINNRLDDLETENKKLTKDLKETRERENKLLNRFSWLILILNYSSAIVMFIVVFTFINSVYPFIKNLMENDIGVRVVISTVGTAIGGGIIAIWVSFNKYVKRIIEREKDK